MTVDISRKSFRPRRNYAGVVWQQGRVELDSERNEAFAIADRQRRARTIDLVGRCGYPRALTDSFRIDTTGGTVAIGPGRYYVDGLLAENFGLPEALGGREAFEPSLEEMRSADFVPFVDQPFRLDPPAPDPGEGRHLVYLDVWRRTVTHLEDPDLVEIAVGVDTTGREQTIWQVRALGGMPSDATCETPDADLPGWLDAIRPSDGRLSVFEVPQDEPDDPCELPPGAGYRALENRTYRVEIHDRTPDGTWRFKWSRHNGVIATRVLTIVSATELAVARVAKDDVLRFEAGDWIEIRDDRLELDGEPGIMRMVDTADPGTDRITLRTAIPAGLFPTDADGTPDPDRNLRVRKWSQAGTVRASGGGVLADLTDETGPGVVSLPPPGEFVALEAGIGVRFSFADGGADRFRLGDHWTFVARTADASVETLDAAPPDGIHHHYCKLAFVDAGPNGFAAPAEDCRDPFPDPGAEGCCTVVVRPGESIQAAIDSLPAAGGCVCLKAGLHLVRATVAIARDDVTLHGESQGAVVRLTGDDPVIAVRGASYARPVERVRIHGVRLEGGAVSASAGLLDATFAFDLLVEDCTVATLGGAEQEEPAFAGIRIAASRQVSVARAGVERVRIGLWATVRTGDLSVTDCRFALEGGFGAAGTLADFVVGPILYAGNEITGAAFGVVIDDDPDGVPASLARGSIVRENRIRLALPPGLDPDPAVPFAGVSVAADDCRIEGNDIAYPGSGTVGIQAFGAGARVVDNRCRALAEEREGAPGAGIVLGVQPGRAERRIADALARGNAISGTQSGILVVEASGVVVADNAVALSGRLPLVGVLVLSSRDVAVRGNRVSGAAAGIGASGCGGLSIEENRVEGGERAVSALAVPSPTIAGNRIEGASLWGIAVVAAIARTTVSANRVVGCGFRGTPGIGIGAYGVLGELDLERNEIMNTGNGPDGERSARAIGLFGDLVLEARVAGNLVTYAGGEARDPTGEDRALLMRGFVEQSLGTGEFEASIGFAAKILGNSFLGTGFGALVELTEQPVSELLTVRFERVTFSDNFCWHVAPPVAGDDRGTVSLTGRHGIVMGNHVKATTRDYFSFNLNGMGSTYLGNVVEGPAILGATTPVPQGDYNIDT